MYRAYRMLKLRRKTLLMLKVSKGTVTELCTPRKRQKVKTCRDACFSLISFAGM
jgi:hypothetical protein